MSSTTIPKHDDLVEEEEVAVSDGGVAKFATIEVKSGEERLDLIYSDTGKLMRFDEGENAWKERGQGVVKLFAHKDHKKRFTLIMRREGIGKLAAYHHLQKGMTIKAHQQSEKAVMWATFAEFSEHEEGYPEMYVLRLGSKEAAQKFIQEFEKCVKESAN